MQTLRDEANLNEIKGGRCWMRNKYSIAKAFPSIWVSPHCIVCLCSIMLLPTMSCPQRPRWSVNSERHSVLVPSSMGEVSLMCPREGVRSGCDAQWESCKVQGEAGNGGQTPDEGLWAELPVHQPPATQHLPGTRECKNARTLQRTCLPILLTYTHLLQEEAQGESTPNPCLLVLGGYILNPSRLR